MSALSHAYFVKPSGVGYTTAAVQSVSVTTNTARNPLSALGYKGNVGFIKQPATADVTVEEFLPAGLTQFTNATATSVGTTKITDLAVADDADPTGVTIAGALGCVLTGVTFNFTAGQPARVTWTYLGKGGSAALTQVVPTAASGVEKTVLLWEDVNLVTNSLSGYLSGAASGIQTVTFNGTINKDTLFALGTSGVYQHVTTFPVNITVSIESYESLVNTVPSGKAFSDASGNIAVGPVRAITVVQTSKGQSVSVGGFRTNNEQYTAADLEWYTS